MATWQNTPSSPASTDSFLYDGEGYRVEQVATSSGGTTTTTTYVGGLEELTTTGSTTTTTASYGGLALSVNGSLSYTLSDGLGSVSETVATSGTVSATQLYGTYGAVRYQSGTLPTSEGYTGQRADAATGLDYYGARYYDPVAGQFSLYACAISNPETTSQGNSGPRATTLKTPMVDRYWPGGAGNSNGNTIGRQGTACWRHTCARYRASCSPLGATRGQER